MLTINRKRIGVFRIFRNPTIAGSFALFKRSKGSHCSRAAYIPNSQHTVVNLWGDALLCPVMVDAQPLFLRDARTSLSAQIRAATLSAARTQAVRPVGNKNSPILGTTAVTKPGDSSSGDQLRRPN